MSEGVLGGGDAGAQGGSNGAGAVGNAGGSGSAGNGNGGNSPGSAGGGGQGTGTWRDSLPEDIRSNEILSKFSDVGNLAKSYIHAQQTIGKKGVIVPQWDKSTPEEQAEFFKSIGVPEADKYEIATPKEFKGNLDQYKAEVSKLGLLPRQASALLEWHTKNEAEAKTAQESAQKADTLKKLDGLKQEWGEAYTKNLGAGELFLKEKGGKDAIDFLVETGMNNNPVMIKLLSEAGKLMGEDKLREGGVSTDGQSPNEIQSELDQLRANGDVNGLYDSKHPMHNITLQKMESLARKLTNGR